MPPSGSFKRTHPTSERLQRAQLCPSTSVPIILEHAPSFSAPMGKLEQSEFFVGKTTTLGEFLYRFRRDHLSNAGGGIGGMGGVGGMGNMARMAVFVFVRDELKMMAQTMESVYDEGVEIDGWCYLVYALENTFGSSGISDREDAGGA
ncbi:hypothetical protein EDC01DRAFT_746727 [Geopyxis carbonaria]|nr:hypothetical protein EDC01DRAFT_746727 [Geopyxis carbonaria]